MAVSRVSLSSIKQGFPKSRSFLDGNSAYIPSSFESIASATGTGSSGTITFSSIPSTYVALQLRYFVLSTSAQILRLQFNSDTGTNYARHQLKGEGSTGTVSAAGLATQSFITIGDTANGVGTTYFSAGITDIHNYASTSQYKTVRDFGGQDTNAASAAAVCLNSGLWMSTSALNSISFYIPSGSFTTSTTVALYGIKGA